MVLRSITITLALACAPALVAAADATAIPTLEQIMADPDWLGNQPENSYWGDDSRTVFFEQKRNGSALKDLFSVNTQNGAVAQIAESDWSRFFKTSIVSSNSGQHRAWTYSGDIYLSGRKSPQQVTRTTAVESAPMFMSDGRRVAFERDEQMFEFDPANGFTEQLTNIRFENDPADEEDFDVLRTHQERLYRQIREAKEDEVEARERRDSLYAVDEALGAAPIYMGDKISSEGQSMSPNGRWHLVVTSSNDFAEGKSGSMPNYVTASGHVENRETRTRVGRNGYAPHTVWLVDLESGEKFELDQTELPGIKDDPLADLRESAVEYYVDLGEDREAAEKRLKAPETRGIEIYSTQWSPDGSQAVLWVHASDNKDRWIATIDFEAKKLVSQHRISDEAWVNNYHRGHGWLRDSKTLWFLSEDHGYLGLYTKNIGEADSSALVAGEHVVFEPTLGPSGDYIYYQANVEHPGIYEIWRVDVDSGKADQLTNLGGVNEFLVSPDESRLLITHSETNRHPELFVQANKPGAKATPLTSTMSDEFKAIDWQQPAIVEVPSSHSDQPIYSKIYLPADHDPEKEYPAVMFVHGAGYTQNSHMGWPYYFREGMFHNLLTERGYVVIDMDFRASEGYGRDWRTAIYRRMGVPELEDFHDGVDYIVENYGVNRERIGVYGGSYGGFMTFVAMFRAPDLFKAGAALRPVSDWSHYNHGYTSNILNTPNIDPEAYRISSPIEDAEGLKNPLLIAAGMQDNNVFFQDSVLVVQRLLELKKQDFEIALYPLDPHGFVNPESWLDEYRRILKLFEANLK
ncbi:MAG: prolyl oligopeptidase family serine peptidase [Gammaproteobacteria bacterium]|jgi:dipeptidyl aminopeptidase/acylaminoacyl peptidase|nr:prolyl oligopeptidase family serine peptidase [Gammaproteobacteria bacterium]